MSFVRVELSNCFDFGPCRCVLFFPEETFCVFFSVHLMFVTCLLIRPVSHCFGGWNVWIRTREVHGRERGGGE